MSILNAVSEVAGFLEAEGIPYAVIGGLAVQYWSESRGTRDVDIVVMVPEEKLEDFLKKAAQRFAPRLADALSFARQNRVLLLSTMDGTPVDISLGIAGYEEEAVRRAVTAELPGGVTVRMITAEDLIIHKCLAGRARDVEDVERILVRQRLGVDLTHIRKWLQEFAPLVESHDVLAVFEQALAKAGCELPDREGQ
jgi:predicted nucleotidyltransferase